MPYDPSLAPHFARLNREWIERFFVLEPADRAVLEDPAATIIAPGGMIYFAVLGEEVVGTCAVLPHDDGTLELAKMAVSPAAQGRGIGRLLGQACIDYARGTGAPSLMLLSSSLLPTALRLYETLGFRHAPMPEGVEYARADVHMVLPL